MTLTESTKILDKVSEKLNLLVCSGYDQKVSSPRHKAPKAPSDVHMMSNGAVASGKAAVISRNKSSMKKDTRHFDTHNNAQGHLLNGN